MSNLSFHYAMRPAIGTSYSAVGHGATGLLTISAATLPNGFNTLELPERKGMLEFVKQGDHFLQLVWIDEAGLATRLEPKPVLLPRGSQFTISTLLPGAAFGMPEARQAFVCFVA